MLLLAALSGSASNARAEDLKGRWSFGASLSFLSTTDDIRSNAGIFLGNFGDDGLPGTADPNEALSCDDTGAFCDPRPDDLIGRRTTVEETVRYDLTAAFGFWSWLTLQLDAGYFRSEVGPIDFYVTDVYPTLSGGQPGSAQKSETIPALAGELTEIPVTLTAILRLRRDGPLNPYFGAGGGMIFTELDESPDLAGINRRLTAMRIRRKADEFNVDLPQQGGTMLAAEGRIPIAPHLVTASVDDVVQWHLTGGVEYFLNDRVSVVFDARYSFADGGLQILAGGEDQVNLDIFSEELFRADGSVKFFDITGTAPNPTCAESLGGYGCFSPPSSSQRVRCPLVGAVGDFDGNGVRPGDPDICYTKATFLADPYGGLGPDGQAVVQGGRIDLSGFSVAVGMRMHF